MSELQTQKMPVEVLERQGRGRREESDEEEKKAEVEQAVYGCRCVLVCWLLRLMTSCVDAVRE